MRTPLLALALSLSAASASAQTLTANFEILSEGGPTVFGSLLASGGVDELFLTISPLLAGRGFLSRLSLVEGLELLPGATVDAHLLSARRHEQHLFLRYRLS